jgi:hypothetical protein
MLQHMIKYIDFSIKNNSDKIGILLCGTKESKNLNLVPNLYTLMDLDDPDIVKLKELQDLLESNHFEEKIGITSDYSIRDCFSECQLMFKKS